MKPAATLIDEVYPDWEESEKMKFDDQYRYLSDALQLLSPMLKNKHTEEDFYKQFDGIKILPQVNKEAYEKHLADYDFISAESQKVQIRKGRFVSWMKSENLKRQTFCFSKGDKINCEDYFITNKVYNSEVGLIADEEEGWKLTEMF
jgi:CRISPR-associated endonuclease/helicase Cas3